MTRFWAPLFKAIQDAIRTAILTERTAQSASLPAGLQGDNFQVYVGTDLDAPPHKPFAVTILPAENSAFVPEVTHGLEAVIEFRASIDLRAGQDAEKLTLLREVVGLIVDGVHADPTLGGLTAGYADQAIQPMDIVAGPGRVGQEVALRFVVRG